MSKNCDAKKKLKEQIENMSKYHQIEILRILHNTDNIAINENSNGTFINLTELPDKIIEPLEAYIQYVNEQKFI